VEYNFLNVFYCGGDKDVYFVITNLNLKKVTAFEKSVLFTVKKLIKIECTDLVHFSA
jgi:hypothetical protein